MANVILVTLLVYWATLMVSAIPLDMTRYKIIEGDILELDVPAVSRV